MAELQPIVMENVRILFPNFSGLETAYNRAGDRNFNIILPRDVAEAMKADGWNVKFPKPREEGDDPNPRLEIAVSYKVRPPQVYVISSRGRTPIGEDNVSMLDFVEYKEVDLIINPYSWDINGNQGIKAYLGSLYVTIVEDPLMLKYASLDEARG